MKGFSAQHNIPVTLSRGGESITLTLFSLPPGFRAWLRSAYPAPVIYLNGSPKGETDDTKYLEWASRFTVILLGKCLAPSSGLVTSIDASDRKGWDTVAEGLLGEFGLANLTDLDLQVLTTAMKEEFLDGKPGN